MKRPVLLLLAALVPSVALSATPSRAAGLWRTGDGSKQVLVGPLATGAFIQKRKELSAQGLAAAAIAVFHANDDDQYVAVFEPTPNAKSVTYLMAGTWDQFAAKAKEMFGQGYRLVDLALSLDPHDARKANYTGIWRSGLDGGAEWVDSARPWDEFAATAKPHFDKGERIVAMSSVAALDDVQKGTRKALFSAVWRIGFGTGALYIINPRNGPEYTQQITDYFNKGLRSVAFNVYTLNGSAPVYTGAVRGGLGTPGEWSSAALKWPEFLAEHAKRVKQGMRLIDLSVYNEFVNID